MAWREIPAGRGQLGGRQRAPFGDGLEHGATGRVAERAERGVGPDVRVRGWRSHPGERAPAGSRAPGEGDERRLGRGQHRQLREVEQHALEHGEHRAERARRELDGDPGGRVVGLRVLGPQVEHQSSFGAHLDHPGESGGLVVLDEAALAAGGGVELAALAPPRRQLGRCR